MSATIPHTAPPLDDCRVVTARQVLAELPEADGNEQPYFWIGRLKTCLRALADGWPSGVPGGLDSGQRQLSAAMEGSQAEEQEPDVPGLTRGGGARIPPAGVPVLAGALADAIARRSEHTDAACADCDADPSGLCGAGAEDADLADAYEDL